MPPLQRMPPSLIPPPHFLSPPASVSPNSNFSFEDFPISEDGVPLGRFPRFIEGKYNMKSKFI